MTTSYKVTQAAAFVVRKSGTSELVYRDAPVPDDAVNLDALIEGGFIEKVGSDGVAGGHPSDLPPAGSFVDPGLQAPVVPADPPPAKPAAKPSPSKS